MAARPDMHKRTVRSLGDPQRELERYMARFGSSAEALTSQVDDMFGEVRHAVASGSVPAGYATRASDLDMYVVVDNPDVNDIPVVSHELGPLIDIYYLDDTRLRRELEALANTDSVDVGSGNARDHWFNQREFMTFATRLAISVVVSTTPPWVETQSWITSGWLIDRAAAWWRDEAHRRLTAATWLRDRRPLLAAQAALDAGTAALQAVTTDAGFVYFGPKWTARELRAMERPDLLETYRQLLRGVARPDKAPDFVSEVTAVVDDLVGPPDPDLMLVAAFLHSVEGRAFGERTVLWRWEMEGAVVDTTDLPDPTSTDVCWRGRPADRPPKWLAELFAAGFVWMGVARGSH